MSSALECITQPSEVVKHDQHVTQCENQRGLRVIPVGLYPPHVKFMLESWYCLS